MAEDGNSLRGEMKDAIQQFLIDSKLLDYRFVEGEGTINEMAADLADTVFGVMSIPETIQDQPLMEVRKSIGFWDLEDSQ